MTPTVLLTGATGFVGRQILHSLQSRGIKPLVVTRRSAATEPYSNASIASEILTEDLFAESAEWWTQACSGIDTIIHAAWYTEPGKYLRSPKNLDCLSGTLVMARGAARAGVRRFVGVGTCFEYDLSDGVLSAHNRLSPSTSYAAAKAAAYIALSQWFPEQSIEFAWCRLFYLFGEGEDVQRLVPYLHAKLAANEEVELTSGEQIRDFLDVREAGRLIAQLALGTQCGPVNICSGVPITVRQLAESIAATYGRVELLKFGARPDNLVDPPCVVGVKNLLSL